MITMTNELTQWYLKDYLNNKQDDSKRILRCFLDLTLLYHVILTSSKSNFVEKRYNDL